MSDIPPGWYDDGSGIQRWWDGYGWTEDVLVDRQQAPAPDLKSKVWDAVQEVGSRLTAKHDPSGDSDAIWAAVGKPVAGFGGGGYKLTTGYLIIETGLFSTNREQIPVRDIREVHASQTMSQKIRNVGSIILRINGSSGDKQVILADVPDFRVGAVLIGNAAERSRTTLPPQSKVPSANDPGWGQGAPVDPTSNPPPPTPAAQHAAAMGLNTELLRLVQMHTDGVLTDQEFAAAKAKLLDL